MEKLREQEGGDLRREKENPFPGCRKKGRILEIAKSVPKKVEANGDVHGNGQRAHAEIKKKSWTPRKQGAATLHYWGKRQVGFQLNNTLLWNVKEDVPMGGR